MHKNFFLEQDQERFQQNLKQFLQKYQNQIKKSISINDIKARILYQNVKEDITIAAKAIQNGELVAFYTETVYGLGASALNEDAIKKIFITKDRPQTDPIIVHVQYLEQSYSLIDATSNEKLVLKILAKEFWPGPLTLIFKCNKELIKPIITANTGYVGIRLPCSKLKIAMDLIKESNSPIAAPSANKFSHISPTKSVHVFNDLYDKEIYIMDGGQSQMGIESTVLKIEEVNSTMMIEILRFGSLPHHKIQLLLHEIHKKYNLNIKMKDNLNAKNYKRDEVMKENSIAPGQFLKHYSPEKETFLLNEYSEKRRKKGDTQQEINFSLSETAVIDLNQKFSNLKNKVFKYYSLNSKQNDVNEIMYNLYSTMRDAENDSNIKTILINNLRCFLSEIEQCEINQEKYCLLKSIYDKIYRSSQGKIINFDFKNQKFYDYLSSQNE